MLDLAFPLSLRCRSWFPRKIDSRCGAAMVRTRYTRAATSRMRLAAVPLMVSTQDRLSLRRRDSPHKIHSRDGLAHALAKCQALRVCGQTARRLVGALYNIHRGRHLESPNATCVRPACFRPPSLAATDRSGPAARGLGGPPNATCVRPNGPGLFQRPLRASCRLAKRYVCAAGALPEVAAGDRSSIRTRPRPPNVMYVMVFAFPSPLRRTLTKPLEYQPFRPRACPFEPLRAPNLRGRSVW